ncbi:MAG TPA: hopanoid biosynthesis-associated protein HpnK [Blastocatellia bacterium]|nr:hopanoid biosynthesis-associated protein HpnK [Blastocatellia bacterium]
MNRESLSERPPHCAAFAASKGRADSPGPHARANEAGAAAPDPKRPRLIVNADDFGLSEEVNEAVIRAHKEGVLTSASLMVTGDAFKSAVRSARENPGLAVGIHLVTVMGRAALSRGEIPSLVDREGNFSNDPTAAGLKYFFSPQARRELRKEVAAQFDKFHSTGLRLSHIDGHLHLHVHPVIFDAALRLGIKYGARRMRVPEEERRLALGFDRENVLRKTIHAFLFGGLSRYMKRKLDSRGFTVPERVYGNLQSGKMNEQYFLYAIDNLRAATNEIYFHPAVYPARRPLTADERQRSLEFQALTSDRVKGRLDQLGVRLSNYFDLEANP